jgi:transposase InsO family protein
MGMNRLVVTAVVVEGRSKSEVAREYKVSRQWVITLVKRYQAEGWAGIEPRSRRPHSSPGQTAADVEESIVRLRKKLDRGGHEAGAATIAAHLERQYGTTPAVSTIWRILSARGFVTPQPHKRPKNSYKRFEAAQPNEMWTTDTTHWELADGTDVEILNTLDDHSRYDLISKAKLGFKAPDVDKEFRKAFTSNGEPNKVLSDNGAIFTGKTRGGGRVALEMTLRARGIGFRHSRPYHPQCNGKVERFHQTQKKWLRTQPRAKTVAGLQRQLDRFRDYYNNERPHRALRRRTPAEAYHTRPKAVPTGTPILDTHYRVRYDKIDSSGVFTLRHNSKLHHIGVGRRHAGTEVTVLVDDLHIRVINRDGELIRELTLDPRKDYQNQPKP